METKNQTCPIKIFYVGEEDTVERYKEVIKWIPIIKEIIANGGNWEQIKGIAEPLGLIDSAFVEITSINDFLLDVEYWKIRIKNYEIVNN